MNIKQIRYNHIQAGGHFFDMDTISFFDSKVYPEVFTDNNGAYLFITSERYDKDTPRYFNVRYIHNLKWHRINTYSPLNTFTSRKQCFDWIKRNTSFVKIGE